LLDYAAAKRWSQPGNAVGATIEAMAKRLRAVSSGELRAKPSEPAMLMMRLV